MDPMEEYLNAAARGYVTPEEVERWSGTDRSTRLRAWWYDPCGITRWDTLKQRVESRLIRTFGRKRECGCRVLTKKRLRFWCADDLFEHLGVSR